jgi:exodeoxyribonuclease VII large subunit
MVCQEYIMSQALEVGRFVAMVRSTLVAEESLSKVALLGELTKLTLARSGHSYFSLTDTNGSIDCVYFGGNSEFTTKEITEGARIMVQGSVDVYVKTGRMQFKASGVEPLTGIGDLERVRRALIERWRKDGTLDRPRMSAPAIPKRMHIITGEGSAALSDMEKIITDRWPGFNYTVVPVLVQGDRAPSQIIDAIKASQKSADLIIVGRGGGSPEDLWAFNMENVCQAIIDSKVPIVSAVGHESDFLVSDMVADIRASTPSNAIERVVPNKEELVDNISQARDRLDFAIERLFKREKERLTNMGVLLSSAPMRGISRGKLALSHLRNRHTSAVDRFMMTERSRVNRLQTLLSATNPTKVLERGYSMAIDERGDAVTSVAGLNKGDLLVVVMQDGQVETEVKK